MKTVTVMSVLIAATALSACGGTSKEAKSQRVLPEPGYEAPSNRLALAAYKAAWPKRVLAQEVRYPKDIMQRYKDRRKALAEAKLKEMGGEAGFGKMAEMGKEMDALKIGLDAKKRRRASQQSASQKAANKRRELERRVKISMADVKSADVSNCVWKWMEDKPYKHDFNAVYKTDHQAGYVCDMMLTWRDGKTFGSWGVFVLNENGRTYNFHGNLTGGGLDKLPNVVLNERLMADPEGYAEWEAEQPIMSRLQN